LQAESKNLVGQEQARRRRAEVALEEAVKEVASAKKDKQLAEMAAEEAQRMLELEVKLRQQLAKEKDQVTIQPDAKPLQGP
jgi:poly-D-alanine transfer protein DltD